jgi:hypothetical protein
MDVRREVARGTSEGGTAQGGPETKRHKLWNCVELEAAKKNAPHRRKPVRRVEYVSSRGGGSNPRPYDYEQLKG